jgi:hypothetical protein
MKKFLALGYMLALPLVSGAKILPSIVTILLFATTSPSGAVGVFQTFNILGLGLPAPYSPTSSRAFSRRGERNLHPVPVLHHGAVRGSLGGRWEA